MKGFRKLTQYFFTFCLALGLSSYPVIAAMNNSEKNSDYQEYQKIVKEVNSRNIQNVSLLPLNDIDAKDFITPQRFQETLNHVEDSNYEDLTAASNLLKASSTLKGTFHKTKSVQVKVTNTKTVTIRCKLSGTYYYNKSTKRCYFGKLNKPTFTVSGGSWKNRGSDCELIDSSRTAVVHLSGKATVGNNYSKNFNKSIEYHCTDAGTIK